MDGNLCVKCDVGRPQFHVDVVAQLTNCTAEFFMLGIGKRSAERALSDGWRRKPLEGRQCSKASSCVDVLFDHVMRRSKES